MPVITETIAVASATPAAGPSFAYDAAAEIEFLHHVAQIAGNGHLAFARHHGGFDGEQLAADVGPGEPGDDADLVLVLDLAVAVLRHAEIIHEVIGLDPSRFLPRHDQFLDRLANQGRELALEVAHARLPRVAADDGQ